MRDLNRNQFFLLGVLLVLLGGQFRLIDTVVLTPEAAKLLIGEPRPAPTASFSLPPLLPGQRSTNNHRTIRPPEWLGYALLSIGAVLILHAMAMPKPEKSG
ncbi:MAG: hypothetical protein NZ602_02890 [Thermoguttaceae bacterium]|nr:hypothetical protein [Thermoguttaceae bacterium]MDW8039117.1 hypothetical protein [Thermoguttaceae bacterium]